MSIQFSVELAGFILLITTLLGFWASMIRGWARVNITLENVNSNLLRIDRELEKRDTQITAIWKRIDELRDLIPGK